MIFVVFLFLTTQERVSEVVPRLINSVPSYMIFAILSGETNSSLEIILVTNFSDPI